MKEKIQTLNANKMLDILITMIEKSWKNEIIMVKIIRDLNSLFESLELDEETENRHTEISDRIYSLKEVNWDEFLAEMKAQQEKPISEVVR